MNITIESEIRKAAEKFGLVADELRAKAIARTLNRIGDQAATLAARRISQTYAFKVRDVRATIKVLKASDGRLEVTVRSKGRRTPLYRLSARQTAQGVRVRIKRNAQTVKGAFIRTMKSGHVGVFKRKGDKRLPIAEMFTIAIPEAFASKEIAQALEQAVRELFPARLESELRYLLTGRRTA